MLRRTKMSRLRRMMLRRKTDPKTGKHTLCEPAQAKCTWTKYNNHFVWKFTGKTTGDTSGTSFCASCAVETHMDMSQQAFCAEIHREKTGRFGYHLD